MFASEVSAFGPVPAAGGRVVAQDATPKAGDEGYTATGDPLVGTEIPYLDEEGDEIAVVTIVEVTDPSEEFSEFFTQEEDARYFAVEVAVESTGDELDVEPFDVGLQTEDGFFISSTFVSQPEGDELPELESTEVEEGDDVSGVLFYAMPEDAELARILWQPEIGHLLVLADLREA